MREWYNTLSLRSKWTLVFVLVFLGGMVIGGGLLFFTAFDRSEAEITQRGEALLETMNAVRTYTSTQVNPLLSERLETEEQFIAETVPGYSARSVFEYFRQDERYADFFYKEAAPNPTNPRDLADSFERDLVAEFAADRNLQEVNGFRELNGERVFYIARPIVVSDESCLRCHSTPDQAPASQLATYGDTGGFGWELNEVVATQIIYTPADDVIADGRIIWLSGMLGFGGIFAIGILLLNRLLDPSVVRPVRELSAAAEQLRDDANAAEPDLSHITRRGDELGTMARSFESMAQSVRRREAKMKRELKQLRIEIDQDKRDKEVSRIASSDYFRDLQQRAADMRKRFNDDQ